MTSQPSTRSSDDPLGLPALLRTLRQRALLTQEELAQRSGVSVGTIAGVEAGRTRRPRSGSLRLIADALELDVAQRASLIEAAQETNAPTYEGESVEDASLAVVPAQLPPGPVAFTGRTEQLRRLDDLLSAPAGVTPVAAIAGPPGVGKTALAIHWAHGAAGRFADGQLYVNLRGFDASGSAMTASEALRGFLDALKVPEGRIPAGLDAQVGLYRSILAERRMLIVLDNAGSAEQVRPLLPGSGGCAVVVTSRGQLAGLVANDGAWPVVMAPLSAEEARQMLARRLGTDRVNASPSVLDDIIELAARLPLALAVVAARAALHPEFPLAALAADLRASRRALDAYTSDDASADIRSVFSWSYKELSPEAAGLFRILGLHQGHDLPLDAAASVAGLPVPRVRESLTELVGAHLVVEHAPGRFAFHDLLRAYAAERADIEETDAARRAATHRMLDYYEHTACAAVTRIGPLKHSITPPPAQAGVAPSEFDDDEQAVAWLVHAHPAMMACVQQASRDGFDTHVRDLARILAFWMQRRGGWRDWTTVQAVALTTARRSSDQKAQGESLMSLARATSYGGDHDGALDLLRQALDLHVDRDDRRGQADVWSTFGCLYEEMGRYTDAMESSRRAAELYEAVNHRRGLAGALNAAGWYQIKLGDPGGGLPLCYRALSLYDGLDDRGGEAETHDSIGLALHLLGRDAEAIVALELAAGMFRDLGHRLFEAGSLALLGDATLAVTGAEAARQPWRRALAIFEELEHPEADGVRAKLREHAPLHLVRSAGA